MPGLLFGRIVLISGTKKISIMRLTILVFVVSFCLCGSADAQPGSTLLKWTKAGNSFYQAKAGNIVRTDFPTRQETVIVAQELLKPAGQVKPLEVRDFAFSEDGRKVLIYTNTRRVWRYNTRGDYWVLDLGSHVLSQVGKDRTASSLL